MLEVGGVESALAPDEDVVDVRTRDYWSDSGGELVGGQDCFVEEGVACYILRKPISCVSKSPLNKSRPGERQRNLLDILFCACNNKWKCISKSADSRRRSDKQTSSRETHVCLGGCVSMKRPPGSLNRPNQTAQLHCVARGCQGCGHRQPLTSRDALAVLIHRIGGRSK